MMRNLNDSTIAGEITVPVSVTNWNLDCILSGCFEGGSNYWAEGIKVIDEDYKGAEFGSEVISHDGELDIFVNEYGSGDPKDETAYRLTKDKLLNGCEMYVAGDSSTKGRAWNPDGMDAIDYDMILQYALFKKVIYG